MNYLVKGLCSLLAFTLFFVSFSIETGGHYPRIPALQGPLAALASPPPPANVISVQEGESLKIIWTGLTDQSISGYAIYRGAYGAAFTQTATVSSSTTSYTDSGFNPSAPNCYRVASIDGSGNESEPSGITCIAHHSMQVSLFRPIKAGKTAVGDYNGDTIPDLAQVGTIGCSGKGKPKICLGKADIYLGGHYNKKGVPDFTITGEGIGFGHAMVAADMNKDGYDDLVISDPLFPQEGVPQGGRVYMYLGGPSPSTSPAVTINGNLSYASEGHVYIIYAEGLGESMAVIGDFTGNGYPHIAVGTPRGGLDHSGSVKILFGGSALGRYSTIKGLHMDDLMGTTVAAAGDVNGDGYPDIVAGAPNGLQPRYDKKTYLILGGPQPRFAESLPEGVTNFPAAITGLDFNGDLFSDMVLGQYASYDTTQITTTSMFPGSTSPAAAGRSLAPQFPLTSLGDMDRDGHEDLLIKGPTVIFGTSNPNAYSFMSCPGTLTVTGTGDTDGDGITDIIGINETGTYICSAHSFRGLPEIIVISPASDDVKSTEPRAAITGRIKGAITALLVGGREVAFEADGGFQTTVSLSEGVNTIEIIARTPDGRISKRGMTITYVALAPLTVAIESPANNSVLHANPVEIRGTVSDSGARVTVNGTSANVTGTTFTASLSLPEGVSTVTAQANDQYGRQATSTVTVQLVTTGTVAGTVNDETTGASLPSTTVSVTAGASTTAVSTDVQGRYSVTGISAGTVSSTFSRRGYVRKTIGGVLLAGQTLDLSGTLTPAPMLSLAVESPPDNSLVHDNPVTIRGTVSNGAEVTIDGQPATVIDGEFIGSAPLVPGSNNVTIYAVDQFEQNATHTLQVNYQPGPVLSAITSSLASATGVTVSWLTDQPATTVMEYGETNGYGTNMSDGALTTQHSIPLSGLQPGTTYHYRVTSINGSGFGSTSADQTFTTPSFSARQLHESGNVTVMEVSGNYDASAPDGTANAEPRQVIAREYLRTHSDTYDFLVFLSTFDYALPEAGAEGFYLPVKNDVEGINQSIFDNGAQFGSSGRLQGTIDLGNASPLAAAPYGPLLDATTRVLNHELMHRFGAYARYRNPDGSLNSALLGKNSAHWSYLLNSQGSIMYGNGWKDNGDGTFTSTSARTGFSPLDLYLMGMVPKEQVPAMLLIENPAVDNTQLPQLGATISGTAKTVTIDDIIATEGARVPDATASQKKFNVGFVLLTRAGDSTAAATTAIEVLRNAWAGRLAELTQGVGGINGVAPSLTVTIDSPTDGATITAPDVTVSGSVINSSGAETGVTVNGMVAAVTGSRFIANHVPLQEGSNGIIVTATDANGLTATATKSITVQAGNYIRISSTIESGVAPLEVSLRLDGSFSIANPVMTISGPVSATLAPGESGTEFTTKLNVEGTYTVTASAIGPDGKTYTDSVTMLVENRAKIDNLLRNKWKSVNGYLASGNITKALSLFTASSREQYRAIFNELAPILPNILATFGEFRTMDIGDGTARYKLTANEEGTAYAYDIEFVTEENGLWLLRSY